MEQVKHSHYLINRSLVMPLQGVYYSVNAFLFVVVVVVIVVTCVSPCGTPFSFILH